MKLRGYWAACAAALLVALSPGAAAEWLYFVAPHEGVTLVDSEDPAWWMKDIADDAIKAGNITFVIDYQDAQGQGFRDASLGPARRARLEEALDYIARILNESGTLDVRIEPSETDGSGALARGGTFFQLAAGVSGGTAFQRLKSGVKPAPNNPEISIRVDLGFNWHFGVDPPPQGAFDFISVMVHEVTHALGCSSLISSTGASLIAPNVHTRWDTFLGRSGAAQRVVSSANPPTFIGVPADLTSGDLFFFGNEARARNGNNRPKCFAPGNFQLGSSLSHFDSSLSTAVMKPAIAPGTRARSYQDFEIGMLIDLGYNNVDPSQNGFTVTANRQGQGTAQVLSNQTIFQAGATVSLLATPANGSTFKEWIGAVANKNQPQTTITVNWDETVTAVFQQSAQIQVAPNPGGGFDFGNIPTGQLNDTTFTVTNPGGSVLNGQAQLSNNDFTIVGASAYNLNGGQNQTIRIRFSPSQQRLHQSNLVFTGGSNNIFITIRGTGVAPPVIPPPPPPPNNTDCAPSDGPRSGAGSDLAVLLATVAILALSSRRARKA